MPLPSPDAYRKAQLAARAASGGLQEQAIRNIIASLRRLSNELARQLATLENETRAVQLARSSQIVRNVYTALNNRLGLIVGSDRALSFTTIRGIWDQAGIEAAQSVGVSGAVLGQISAPPITMVGAYESLAGAGQTWRTLLQGHVQNAAREANLIIRNGILSGVGPDELGRQLRPYVAGSENFQGLFERVGGATGEVRKLDLRTLPRELRGKAGQMVHNANRIAFSELHNARAEAQVEHFNADPLIAAVDWMLSPFRGPSAKIPDECDVLATANFYGLGPGRYPLNAVPVEPHPWGRCEQIPVTRSTRDMHRPKPQPGRLSRPRYDAVVQRGAGTAKQWKAIQERAMRSVEFGEEAFALRAVSKPLPIGAGIVP